jgi:predicted Fe-Mo cluster-binding NifX family protein
MLAIPVDTKESNKISDKFGNVEYFAFVDGDSITVEANSGKGDGMDTAEFLNSKGVSATAFYHMGEGVYKRVTKHNISVYTADHQYLSIDEIKSKLKDGSLIKLTEENYKELLDPGHGPCTCGCERE